MSKAVSAGGLKGYETISLNISVILSCVMNGKVSVSDLSQYIVVSSASDERHKHLCEFSQFPGLK